MRGEALVLVSLVDQYRETVQRITNILIYQTMENFLIERIESNSNPFEEGMFGQIVQRGDVRVLITSSEVLSAMDSMGYSISAMVAHVLCHNNASVSELNDKADSNYAFLLNMAEAHVLSNLDFWFSDDIVNDLLYALSDIGQAECDDVLEAKQHFPSLSLGGYAWLITIAASEQPVLSYKEFLQNVRTTNYLEAIVTHYVPE